jgi:mono/diheme cytochrome c family protein
MTMDEPRMTTHISTTTRRSGALALFGGAMLAMALSVTATPAAQAPDAAAKPGATKVDPLELYQTKCQSCHMADGNSQVMPNMSFADGVWVHGSTLKEVQTTITNGVPGTAMVPFKEQLTPAEITALAKFVRKFDKKLK